MVTFFPCLIYRFFSVLLKFQIYRDFPVLVTTFLCFNYRVFPALIIYFPCFGYIISLFYEHFFPVLFTGFSLLLQNSMLLFFKEQGNPCYKNIKIMPVQNAYISLYFNEIWPFKPCTLPKHVRVELLHREIPVKNLYFPVRYCSVITKKLMRYQSLMEDTFQSFGLKWCKK